MNLLFVLVLLSTIVCYFLKIYFHLKSYDISFYSKKFYQSPFIVFSASMPFIFSKNKNEYSQSAYKFLIGFYINFVLLMILSFIIAQSLQLL